MCQRHIPAGGGAAALAGTRRVALGALGGGVGWGGDGWYWSGGHWRDRCLCGKNRKTRKHVLVSFLLFLFLFFVLFFCFLFFCFAMLEFFTPPPLREVWTCLLHVQKRRWNWNWHSVSLFAHFYYVLPPCVAHPRAVSVFFVELFPLNVQTWFSHEGPMLDRFQIFYLFHPGWTPVEQPHTINYPNKL